MAGKKRNKLSLARIHNYIDALCGLYSRVARRLGVHRSFVSRVARGARSSPEVESALTAEFKQVQDRAAP